MFQLVEMKRMVQVPPWMFDRALEEAVTEQLNNKLANKVILDVGLCIALFDLVSVGDSYIFPGDGSSHSHITFRFIVYRPFLEEIIEGTIKSANEDGIQISLGFFEDVYIQKDFMTANSEYNEAEKVWVWNYQTDDVTHPMFMDIGEKIRFRVTDEKFTDTTPNPNALMMTEGGSSGTEEEPNSKSNIPYVIYGTINDHGLGLVSWWATPEEAEDEEMENDEVT